MSASLVPEQRIGRYKIGRFLGAGGFGQVYEAHTETGERLAIKIADLRGIGAEVEKRGAELQRQLAELDHRIARVRDILEIDGKLAIAMDLMNGQNLARLIRDGNGIEPRVAVLIIRELCGMLRSLAEYEYVIDGTHRCGAVHGDLKPANIFIEGRKEVKVVDFGVASAASAARQRGFSQEYCSPERLRDRGITASSDLWSVGVVFYEMLAGARPFATPEGVLSGRRCGDLPVDCPARISEICLKMLSHQLPDRYPSAQSAEDALARFLDKAALPWGGVS